MTGEETDLTKIYFFSKTELKCACWGSSPSKEQEFNVKERQGAGALQVRGATLRKCSFSVSSPTLVAKPEKSVCNLFFCERFTFGRYQYSDRSIELHQRHNHDTCLKIQSLKIHVRLF